jgi:hypothetical protein
VPRKQPFPPEADTQPEMRRPSGLGPKSKRQAEPTVPPPKSKRAKAAAKGTETKNSGIRSRRPAPPKDDDTGGASIDEVTADLSKDPRRERDE